MNVRMLVTFRKSQLMKNRDCTHHHAKRQFDLRGCVWLHDIVTIRLSLEGQEVTFVTISVGITKVKRSKRATPPGDSG